MAHIAFFSSYSVNLKSSFMQIYFFVIKLFIMQEFANEIHMRGFETALNKQIPKIRVYEFCNIKI